MLQLVREVLTGEGEKKKKNKRKESREDRRILTFPLECLDA